MNAPIERKPDALGTEVQERIAVLEKFRVVDIQHMERGDLLAAKNLAGHGSEWGYWLTPTHVMKTYRNINLRKRLCDYLEKEGVNTSSISVLIDEGVLVLTRIALLMKLITTGGRNKNSKTERLKPSSIAHHLYNDFPKITARAIKRKASKPTATGLFQCLTESDVLEFNAYHPTRVEVERLHTLAAQGVWSDAPSLPDIRQITNPASNISARISESKSEPHLPLPENWLAQIGPRILWVVEDMGPNLLLLLQALRSELKDIDWSMSGTNIGRHTSCRINEHLDRFPWLDRSGEPLFPPFRMPTHTNGRVKDHFEWPPRKWGQITALSVVLQAAHIFITLLCSAGRIGEVMSLRRGCVEIARDGNNYVKGFTYKLSSNLFGDARTWPAPHILVQCLGQQARLAEAWDWLPRSLESGLPQAARYGDSLWVSIGMTGTADEYTSINTNKTLFHLAIRLDMDPRPGGKNVHAHRFRKTIGRLAGVALFNSPLVLKRLFGHKSIEMTLHYILCDPGVREEAEKVLRELRIMHCAEALEEIHQAMRDGTALPGHGGPGAARLITTVRNEEAKFGQSGRLWTESSAYDLACLLTMQGQGWRLIKDNIVCSKAPGEDGLCLKNRPKGEPNTANCQPECGNRIAFARKRRDVELCIEQYLDLARQALNEGQLLVLESVMINVQDEWASFPDIEQKYRLDPDVQALLSACEEPEVIEEVG